MTQDNNDSPLPVGKIKRLVHFTGQSSRLENVSAVPTRNSIGYGHLEANGEELYFEAGALDVAFEELQVGQPVEFRRDPGFAVASAVRPISPQAYATRIGTAAPRAAAAAAGADAAARPAAGAAKAAGRPGAPGGAKKGHEEAPTLVLASSKQCLFVSRYQKIAEHDWARVRRQPEIETYTTEVADEFREPQVACVSERRCVIRVYDERAIDLNHRADLLGDFAAAQARCDQALLSRFPGDRLDTEVPPLQT